MEEKLNLRDLYRMVKKHLVMIVAITIVAMVISGVVSKFAITPIYQSSTQILVNQADSENIFDVNVVKSNLELINTYSVIMKSPLILEKVIKELDLNRDFEVLYEQVAVSSQEDSQVVVISVEDENQETAANIANSITKVFESEIKKVMKVDNVNVLYPAMVKPNPEPIKPQPALNVVVAGLAGLFLGIGIAFTRDYFDNTIKTEADIENKLGLPALGSITTINETGITSTVAQMKTKKKDVGGKMSGS
ncbi:capsular biosynthesis protein [Alkalihalobacillus hwajinpoensis]|uniref:YveK family protein n=1 Tax=Guptibacillus hwajinpoensis TaxID=208199 RepID=UPI0018848138|nr:Wzz/FepE/Etk N-terminal domain-containing protein [Pseudalkalibacillus hwajinpoensis]MBF0705359.1 capsular biosynthesis protein [Pseudalkalibacillus hwajinpoensis]